MTKQTWDTLHEMRTCNRAAQNLLDSIADDETLTEFESAVLDNISKDYINCNQRLMRLFSEKPVDNTV